VDLAWGSWWKIVNLRTLSEEEAKEIGLISDWYEIDWERAKELGVLSDIVLAKHFGGLKPVHECVNCDYASADEDEFGEINAEEPRYGMNDPYSGCGGDPICKKCLDEFEEQKTEAEISRMEYRMENPPDFGRGERYAH
jgi:hypothetical protein